MKHITSPLRAKHVNGINRFVTMVCYTTITILDIIRCPAFYLKHNVSETVFCLRIQVEPTQMGPIKRAPVPSY
jgi:hypothetical protein